MNLLGKRSIPLVNIDPLLAQMPPAQLHEALERHISHFSLEMFLLRLARPSAAISTQAPLSLKVQPAPYLAEMFLFFMVMLVVLAIVGYLEGHSFSDALIIFSTVPIIALSYCVIILSVSKKLFDSCCLFLGALASDSIK